MSLFRLPIERVYHWLAARTYVTCALVLLVLTGFSLALDVPIARLLRLHPPRGDLRRFIMVGETFGFGFSVALIILTAAVLDLRQRRRTAVLLLYAFAPGISVNILKALVARARPLTLDLTSDVWQTFLGVLPIWKSSGNWGYAIQSFPSGHTATAVGLAIGLSRFYPQGRWLFAGFATLTAVQRMVSGAHFASDTLFGAAIAFFCAAIFEKMSECWSRPAVAQEC